MAQAEMSSGLDSQLIFPGENRFEQEREIWNGAIDHKPFAIARCSKPEDVKQALNWAKNSKVPVSIKGGGHNIAGTAAGNGALMISLSGMKGIEIDFDQQTVRVGGGATWHELDSETQKHGFAVPGGVVSTTGVAGLSLGGGFGWLARLHGLSADNLVCAEIVLADGKSISVSQETHQDLFWAIRGGSGNFGVVTEFTFKMHKVGQEVLFGPTFFALEDAAPVLNCYAANAHQLSREACVWANLMTAPPVPVLPETVHGSKVLALMQFHANVENGEAELNTLYGGIKPLGTALAPRPYTEAQTFLDDAYEFGARNYWRAHNHRSLSPQLIEYLVERAKHLPSPESELLICQLGGAIADVASDATAFPHRQVLFMSTPGVRWRRAQDDQMMINWLKETSDEISKHAEPGAYVNFIAERKGRAHDAYGKNESRLQFIKQRYDPGNLFRINQNLSP